VPSPATRVGAIAAGLLGVWTFGVSGAAAQTTPDEHAGVLSVQGTQDVATPAAPAPVASETTPVAVEAPSDSALPVTGSDVVGLTAVGLGLVASGFVLKRRYSR
jgi:LPXTG-motif cell wall-anchored protein